MFTTCFLILSCCYFIKMFWIKFSLTSPGWQKRPLQNLWEIENNIIKSNKKISVLCPFSKNNNRSAETFLFIFSTGHIRYKELCWLIQSRYLHFFQECYVQHWSVTALEWKTMCCCLFFLSYISYIFICFWCYLDTFHHHA